MRKYILNKWFLTGIFLGCTWQFYPQWVTIAIGALTLFHALKIAILMDDNF